MDWNTVSSLLWLLAWAALFFLMMGKGGCGMHGGHHDRSRDAPTSNSTGDPDHAPHRHHGR